MLAHCVHGGLSAHLSLLHWLSHFTRELEAGCMLTCQSLAMHFGLVSRACDAVGRLMVLTSVHPHPDPVHGESGACKSRGYGHILVRPACIPLSVTASASTAGIMTQNSLKFSETAAVS